MKAHFARGTDGASTKGLIETIKKHDPSITITNNLETVPTITAVNMTNPWVLDEIEPNAAALIGTFGTKAEAIVDVIRGEFNPIGKLPFALPASMIAVDNEVGDVPSFAPEEDPAYAYVNKSGNAYKYGFGLSYHQGKALGKSDQGGETGIPAHAGKSSKE